MDRLHDRSMKGRAVASSLAVVCLLAVAWFGSRLSAQSGGVAFDPSVRPKFREPVTLESRDGVLEVRLTAHQGHARLDTVVEPVTNFFVYAYEVIQGTPSNGRMSGDNLYPGPTLQVYPGDTLIVHLENGLSGLTIRDNYDPAFTPKGKEVPLYPKQLTEEPINLHTHGLRISPKGNSDNVVLHIGPGLSNTYTYQIRKDHPEGAYWYHPHLHGLTSPQVYRGLIGLLAIGRTDGNIPLVTDNKIPIRNMLLQYNYVFDRKGGLAELSNPNLAAIRQHEAEAEGRCAGQGHVSSAAHTDQFQAIEKRHEALHSLVRGPTVHLQQPWTFSVHSQQFAAFHRKGG